MSRSAELERTSRAFLDYVKEDENFDIMDHRILDLQQAWFNTIHDAVFPVSELDKPFMIFALETLLEGVKAENPDAVEAAKELKEIFNVTSYMVTYSGKRQKERSGEEGEHDQ